MIFRLAHAESRRRASAAIFEAAEGCIVRIEPPKRSLDQSAKFHAMCEDAARQCTWQGKKRTKDDWKVLFVSGHAIATGRGAENVPGLEGEYVNLRESTAQMSKARSSSLIEYVAAWGAMNGVIFRDEVAA